MKPAGVKLAELAQEAARESAELTELRSILEGMVLAKRAGVANPEAWARAFAIVDLWDAEEATEPPLENVTCPDCDQILPNIGSEGKPTRIDCGPEHVLVYRTFSARVGAGRVLVQEHKRGTTPGAFVTEHGPASGFPHDDDADELDEDGGEGATDPNG